MRRSPRPARTHTRTHARSPAHTLARTQQHSECLLCAGMQTETLAEAHCRATIKRWLCLLGCRRGTASLPTLRRCAFIHLSMHMPKLVPVCIHMSMHMPKLVPMCIHMSSLLTVSVLHPRRIHAAPALHPSPSWSKLLCRSCIRVASAVGSVMRLCCARGAVGSIRGSIRVSSMFHP